MGGDAPRIVLSMIVKDEAHVIERCLASVRPLIDAYCIIDTGSTDGTQDLIRQLMSGTPGVVHDRTWEDFATNRTQALDASRRLGEFALMIDADVECRIDPDLDIDEWKRSLHEDVYRIELHDGIRYQRPLLTSTAVPFAYRGVLHEFLDIPPDAIDGGIIGGVHYESSYDGARSQNPTKFTDDAAVLAGALASGAEPDLDARHTFYLAQSLRDAGNTAGAAMVYGTRAAMGGWPEEVYVSLLWRARLLRSLGRPLGESIEAAARAQEVLPNRAEAWCEAAAQARSHGLMQLAHSFARRACTIPEPVDGLFIESQCYLWRALYEYAISAFYADDLGGGARACHRLLYEDLLPGMERQAVVEALEFYPQDAFTYS